MVSFSQLPSLVLLGFFTSHATSTPLTKRGASAIKQCTASSAKCQPYLKSYAGPLVPDKLADPSGLKVDDNTYFVYTTQHPNANVPYAKTTQGLQMGWEYNENWDAMPREKPYGTGDWTVHPFGDSSLWAPDVSKLNSTHYIMYYAATRAPKAGEDPEHLPRCLGVSYSKTPGGPFKAKDIPFLCDPTDGGGPIDPDAVIDNSSNPPRRFVVFKYGSYPNSDTIVRLAIQEVNPSDGFTRMGDVKFLTSSQKAGGSNQDKPPGEEGPAMALMPNGKWTLLHTEGTWQVDYRTVFATSKTTAIDGDYEDGHLNSILIDKNTNNGAGPEIHAPGGPDFFDGTNNLIFAATGSEGGTVRRIFTAEIGYKEVQ